MKAEVSDNKILQFVLGGAVSLAVNFIVFSSVPFLIMMSFSSISIKAVPFYILMVVVGVIYVVINILLAKKLLSRNKNVGLGYIVFSVFLVSYNIINNIIYFITPGNIVFD